MGIISWIVVGLIAGLLAKLLVSGDDPGGIIVTILIGMLGAVIGGLVVGLFGGTGVTGFNVWSILVATREAIILLAPFRLVAVWRAERVGLPHFGGHSIATPLQPPPFRVEGTRAGVDGWQVRPRPTLGSRIKFKFGYRPR